MKLSQNIRLFIVAVFLVCLKHKVNASNRSFYIDFDNDVFVKDGQPFRYVSGSLHPYRVPHELWADRLAKMYAAGLNAVQIYVFWNEHEQYPGIYDFEKQNDIFNFMDIASKTGLAVILRAGPYGCGEHEYGALPWWLLTDGTSPVLPRTSEETYMRAVRKWFSVLLPRVVPYLYNNGGPVIMVQIENEYGSYFACDQKYTNELREIFIENLGEDTILFTTDGGALGYLKCGFIPGVYPTVDFGPGSDVNSSFSAQRAYAPKGPLVNSEYYTGWLDFWGSPHSKTSTVDVLKTFYEIMSFNANLNFYMFHGGTNFGFSNGADPAYSTQPTSYDYDSPISEAGDITNKYLALREAISLFLPIPQVPIPDNSTKIAYGNIEMIYYDSFVNTILDSSNACINSTNPLSFERLGQGYGFVLYMTTLSDPNVYGKVLSVPGIRDRGYVQIGDYSVGVLYRNGNNQNITITLKNNTSVNLYIIVENMGRLNYGNNMLDAKGILSTVTLDGKVLTGWTACLTNNFIPNYQQYTQQYDNSFIKKDLLNQFRIKRERGERLKNYREPVDYKAPAVYIGSFESNSQSFDTFLKMEMFTKGQALIQSASKLTNLGRYWPNVGPQVTLYTPGVFIDPYQQNFVILFELEGSSCQTVANCQVEFIDYPILDSIKN